MRIISQDGFYDLPYENVVISLNVNNRNQVIAWSASDFCKDDLYCVMGNYSTELKAQKAMEMLREQYSRLQVVKILASGTCEHMEKSLSKDEFLECNLKYREMNIFQFPQDEDVEV